VSGRRARPVRATPSWDGEKRPLLLDLPNDKLSREVLPQIREAIDAARGRALRG
jgi:hypothetical protein